MNANHSFRTSITVLTVATIVGSGVMLLSGLSQFRFRPAVNDKTLVSSANQKLRNRFGEFYPAEQRVPAATTKSGTSDAIRTVSQSSTFEEVVTTTSEYDNSEVITTYSSGISAGVPQVSVPVTINVNNGELMAQLIETRESLAEVKAQQSAIRQDQRVFSYQVHKDGSAATTPTSRAAQTSKTSTAGITSSTNHSQNQSTLDASTSESVSHRDDQADPSGSELSFDKASQSADAFPSPRAIDGRNTTRMRSISGANSVRHGTQSSSQLSHASSASTAAPAAQESIADSVEAPAESTEANQDSEFEANKESSTSQKSAFSLEEEVSFEPLPEPAPPAENDDDITVPVIEPISYNVEETVEQSHSVPVTDEEVVEFESLNSTTSAAVPESLPELTFEKSNVQEMNELPVLSLENASATSEFNGSGESTTPDNSSGDPDHPAFAGAERNTDSESSTLVADQAASSPGTGKPRRTREQLASAFAAVRGLPPEDLFGDPSTPFVTPIEPAEPVSEPSLPTIAFEGSDSATQTDAIESKEMAAVAPPSINFGESSGGGLVAIPSSAAAPVELEFGEPSALSPALTQSENPGAPETPMMPAAEPKPERWHKYRSRIHLRKNSGPSSPVPPVPELASTPVPEVPLGASQEPELAPPVAEELSENPVADSNATNSDRDQTITDSHLMIPDEDGTTEVAQNSDSEKLSSSSLPPVPELAVVPELAPVPEQQFPEISSPANNNPVYEPQPVMDRMHEVTAELNAPLMVSPSPQMVQRTMPQKSGDNLPFEITFRRISKRVAWMADALNLPETKTAQKSQTQPKSPAMGRPQSTPHSRTQKHGQAVAKKSSPSKPMQLPKLNVPKFTVQKFALPNVDFRAIQTPSFHVPVLDTPDWLACPPDVTAPVRNSTAVHRMMSTMQFVGQPKVLD